MLDSGYVPVSGGHTIYYECHGAKGGRPAVILHGGPGGGLNREHLRMFDLKKWCILLFDQRGCGKSMPYGSTHCNTTWDLVSDIEVLREKMGCSAWFVQGGSWGTTLALAYAEKYPNRVTGILLRGASLCNNASFEWQYQKGGASEIFPEEWEKFVAVLPLSLHDKGWKSIARYYQKKMNGSDTRIAQRYADAWWGWEDAISQLLPIKDTTTKKEALAIGRLENHYFVHDCWLAKDQLLRGLHMLRHIPITIVHGRYDMVCPVSGALAISNALPHVNLVIVLDAGHATVEPGIMKALKVATRRMYPSRNKTMKKRRV